MKKKLGGIIQLSTLNKHQPKPPYLISLIAPM
jgi:hypothetical protein